MPPHASPSRDEVPQQKPEAERRANLGATLISSPSVPAHWSFHFNINETTLFVSLFVFVLWSYKATIGEIKRGHHPSHDEWRLPAQQQLLYCAFENNGGV